MINFVSLFFGQIMCIFHLNPLYRSLCCGTLISRRRSPSGVLSNISKYMTYFMVIGGEPKTRASDTREMESIKLKVLRTQ